MKRQIYDRLEKELVQKEILVITGMRRVGKTTALKHLYELVDSKNKYIFDMENPLHRKVFEVVDYDSVWLNLVNFGLSNKEKAYLFVDEAQNLPEISRVAKYLYDHYEVKIILTGSSSYYLRNLFPESLAGRKVVVEMFPLIFEEFLEFRGVEKVNLKVKNQILYEKLMPYYREYIQFGGFPGVVLEKDEQRKGVLLEEIFTSYFEKDAKNLSDFSDMAKLRDLILLLTTRVGSKIDIAKIAKEMSMSRMTVYNHLAFLEQTYFISLIGKFTGSIDRKVAGGKKVYLCDSGIANVLGQLSAGALLEQSVFQNLRINHKLEFFMKKGGREVDFVVDGKTGYEIKSSASKQDKYKLRKVSEELKLVEAYIVSEMYDEDEQVKMVWEV